MVSSNACLELLKLIVASASRIRRSRFSGDVPTEEKQPSDTNAILRYSSHYFLSQLDTYVRLWGKPIANISITNFFIKEIGYLVNETSARESRIGTRVTRISSFGEIYGLAQCSRDFSVNDCNACLQEMAVVFSHVFWGLVWRYIYSLSCNFRYETFLFYNISESPPSFAPAPASENAAGKILLLYSFARNWKYISRW